MKFQLSRESVHKAAIEALAMWMPNLMASEEPVFISPKFYAGSIPQLGLINSKKQQSDDLPADL